MSPNIIGSTFILAETAISNTDANNNNKAGVMQSSTSNSSCPESSAGSDSTTSKTTDVTSASTTKPEVAKKKPYEMEIVWHNVLLFIILHSAALYGLYLVFAENAYIDLFLCKYNEVQVWFLFSVQIGSIKNTIYL